jgi:hypothetical protein
VAVDDTDELVLELTRIALGETSPAEVALVDAVGPEWVRAVRAGARGDGALGFDVAQLSLAVVTSSAAIAVVDYLGEVAKAYAVDEGQSIVRRVLVRLRRNRNNNAQTPAEPLSLRPEHVARIRQVAFEHARKLGLGEGKAEVLARSLADSLAGSPMTPP